MQVKTLRRWNNLLHRDIGYLCVGMTLVYAISGIVMNHFKSGDFQHPDYGKSYSNLKVSLPKNGIADQTYVYAVLDQVKERDHYKSFITGEGYVQIFLTKGFMAPSSMVRFLFGIKASTSISAFSPKPVHSGHAPKGLLKEKNLGSNSPKEVPHSSQI